MGVQVVIRSKWGDGLLTWDVKQGGAKVMLSGISVPVFLYFILKKGRKRNLMYILKNDNIFKNHSSLKQYKMLFSCLLWPQTHKCKELMGLDTALVVFSLLSSFCRIEWIKTALQLTANAPEASAVVADLYVVEWFDSWLGRLILSRNHMERRPRGPVRFLSLPSLSSRSLHYSRLLCCRLGGFTLYNQLGASEQWEEHWAFSWRAQSHCFCHGGNYSHCFFCLPAAGCSCPYRRSDWDQLFSEI